MKISSLYHLKPHQLAKVNEIIGVMRVPGGFIYNYDAYDFNSIVFVQNSDNMELGEFKIEIMEEKNEQE